MNSFWANKLERFLASAGLALSPYGKVIALSNIVYQPEEAETAFPTLACGLYIKYRCTN